MACPLITRLEDVPEPSAPLTLAVGAFDGIHRGHADLLRLAGTLGPRVAVLRFHPHPARVIRPAEAPPLLCTEEQIHAQLEAQGVALHIRLPFTPAFATLEPQDFLDLLRQQLPGIQQIVVGPDWRFGARGRGDVQTLRDYAPSAGWRVQVLPESCIDGERISSTRIRLALQRADIPEANRLLGRPYTLTGVVQPGKQFGRQLGFPTANFPPDQELIPPDGVYAMRVWVDGQRWPGAGYLTQLPDLVEVHLLDYSGDLYGKSLAVELVAFRRPPEALPNPETLRQRIAEDVAAIRILLEKTP